MTDTTDTETADQLECLDYSDDCEGPVEYRMALTGTGQPFPRCTKHWGLRLDRENKINDRYPHMQPADFDPGYAGEHWDDNY